MDLQYGGVNVRSARLSRQEGSASSIPSKKPSSNWDLVITVSLRMQI